MEEEYQLLINISLMNTENGLSNINDDIINLHGLCGLKAKHFYNNLLKYGYEPRYLEIGNRNGSSTAAAMYKNKAKILSIDNWIIKSEKDDFLLNYEKFKGDNEVIYIDTDYLNNVPIISSKFNIYIYDGDNSIDCNYKALDLYYNYLDDIFIYIKNDWNDEYVRNETEEAINKLNLKYIYKKEIILEKSLNTWRNGICFFILRK